MRIVGVVHAKGTSERVPNKNLRELCGAPLCCLAVQKLLDTPGIDAVYIDTESDAIVDKVTAYVASRGGADRLRVFRRDPTLATNATDGNMLAYNVAANLPEQPDIVVYHLSTGPFVSYDSIAQCIKTLQDRPEIDAVIGGIGDVYYEWETETRPGYDTKVIPNSKTLGRRLSESMSLYVCRHEAVVRTKSRITDRPLLYVLPKYEGMIDIDDPDDLEAAEAFMEGVRARGLHRRFGLAAE